MFGKAVFYACTMIILVMDMQELHALSTCRVIRYLIDIINIQSKCYPQNITYYFQSVGAEVSRAGQCRCICPRNSSTYMENTQKCMQKIDIWPGCNVGLKAPGAIPMLFYKQSVARMVILPSKLRRYKDIAVDQQQSFFSTSSGWKKINPNIGFPFKIVYQRKKRKYYLQWSKLTQEYNNRVIRLGVSGCGPTKTDCLLFKVQGNFAYNCTLIPTPTLITTTAAVPTITVTSIQYIVPDVTSGPTQQANITTPSHKPSVSGKGKQGSSPGGPPWAITGAIIGVVAVLTVCVIVLVIWFCRWKKKLKKDYNSATSSAFILSPSQSSTTETYAAPHHPYQDLKPPVRGTPPGVYQSLNLNLKEDATGYLLPLAPETQTANDNEPIYNEICSPRAHPTYDYALPEDTVRFSVHSLNQNTTNEPAYVGRPSRGQEEPNASGDSKGAYAAPEQNDPSDRKEQEGSNTSGACIGSYAEPTHNSPSGQPEYLDFGFDENMPPVRQARANTYQESNPEGPREYQQPEPSGVGQVGPHRNGPYQALVPQGVPRYEPLRLTGQNVNNKCSSLV